MRKVILVVIMLSSLVVSTTAQQVKWKFSSVKQTNGKYLLSVTGKISPEWHLYSMASPANGPTPMKIKFNNHPLIKIEGGIKEKGDMIRQYEEVFDMTVLYFEDSVEYTQLVRWTGSQLVKTNITGTIEYMLCTNSMCLPPTKEKFSIALQ
ncbi:MAG: hypothetical protein IBJ16_07545 [Chitinophagaceae bacterium]|nr:hypothetical protein [Chitinophagaceae bacterium]